MNFTLHDLTSAPSEARAKLEATKRSFGMIPNLERVMAESPLLLQGYSTLLDLFGESGFSAIEQQVVYQTVNVANECHYCVPWHTKLSQLAKMSPVDIQALRDGAPLSDPRLETLRKFTSALINNAGRASPSEMSEFKAVGYTERHALEVVLGISVKVMSN